MTSKYATIIFMFFTIFSFSQSKKINDKYYNEFHKFDSLNTIEDKNSFKVLLELQNKLDFKTNDTLKGMVYHSWGNFYLKQRDVKNATNSFDKSASIMSQLGLFGRASVSMHNEAIVYHMANKIDSALIIEEKAINLAKKGNDKKQLYINLVSKASNLNFLGKFKESNDVLFSIISAVKDAETKGTTHGTIAVNYDELGLKDKAEYHYKKSLFYMKKINSPLIWTTYGNIADFYSSNNKFKLALKYSDSILLFSKTLDAQSFYYMTKSTAYSGLKDWKNALQNINKSINIDTKIGDDYFYTQDVKTRGQLYLEMKDYKNAFKDLKCAREKFNLFENVIQKRNVFRDFIHSFLFVNNIDIANDFTQFLKLNDSIDSQAKDKNFFELDTKYQTAQKEAKIKTQQLQIQEEKTNKYLAFGGIGLLVITLFGGFAWFKNNQKNTQLTNQNQLLTLQQNLNAMQLDNLNKQLDPHEIKNILANISPEIQRNAPDAYNKMTKLLNITRASLSSNSITDSIENQLQQIDDYLSLEKTVLPVLLNYSIINTVDNHKQIPRLLLKNLVENSIKHGIKNKKDGGTIDIALSEIENTINISVDDTGSGRQQAISLDSGIGTSTYINLFETLNKTNDKKASFEIIDKQQGTKVEIIIPIDYKYV